MKTALRLSPILIIYVVLILAYAVGGHDLRVDETRYVALAEAFAAGKSSIGAGLDLWSGPGYPVALLPFAKFNLPWTLARFVNAILVFLAALYFYRTLRLYASSRVAYVGAYVVGLYPPVLELAPRLMTEPMAIFLACGFMYHFCLGVRTDAGGKRHVAGAALYLGYLALTRVIFGYVIAACLVGFLLRLAWKRRRADLKGAVLCCLALAATSPYLVHTHSVTGRVFYWGSSGGLSLYWMSSPHKGEYGDFLAPAKSWLRRPADASVPGRADRHREFLDQVQKLDPVQRDDALKRRALENIRAHPGKFLLNWLANIGRLFLNYPFSYAGMKPSTLLYLVPGAPLLLACLLCIYRSYVRRISVPPEVSGLGMIAIFYLAASSVVSAYGRMLFPVLPLLVLWLGFALSSLAGGRLMRGGGSVGEKT